MEEANIVTDPEAGSATLTAVGSRSLHEFIRYFVASLLALLTDTVSLFVQVHFLHVPYLYAGAVSFLLGLVVIYVLSVVWVFEYRTKRVGTELFLFVVIGVSGLGINEVMLWLGSGLTHLPLYLSKFLSVCVVFSWNFAARKYFLFKA